MNRNAAITNAKRFLCVKKLTCSDGFTCKTVKVPRAEARFFIGELRNRQATQLVLLDEAGNIWELMCQCIGGQYALSRIGAFCEAHAVRPGAYFIFYADHDHVVRLAVRQELPEDVQAAIAAARAVMAVRNSPQRPPAAQLEDGSPQAEQQQQQPAELHATVPVLEDATGLEEMPAVEPVLADSTPEPAVVVPAEPDTTSRALPLQDRSNTPDRQSGGLDSLSQPKPLADQLALVKNSGSSSSSMPIGQQASDDKENEPLAAAVTGARDNMKAPSQPITSSGGVIAQNHVQQQRMQQQQKPQAQSPSPARNSGQPTRPPTVPASPPAATRMRMRFEARLRAQAGKLHPLSVRTGPESPPPLPLGWNAGFGPLGWPPLLGGAFPLGLPLMPQPYTHTATQQHWRSGAGLAAAPGIGLLGFMHRTATSPSAADEPHHPQPPFSPQPHQPHMSDLDCSERLDWESGEQARRHQQAQHQHSDELAAAVHLGMPPIRTHGQRQHQLQERPALPLPPWLHNGSPVAAAQSLALAQQLLLHQHQQQLLRRLGAPSTMQQQSSSPPAAAELPYCQKLLACASACPATSLPADSHARGELLRPSTGRAANPESAALRSHQASPRTNRQQQGVAVGSTTRHLVAVQVQRRERGRASGAGSGSGVHSPCHASRNPRAMNAADLKDSVLVHQYQPQQSKGSTTSGATRPAPETPEGSPSAKRQRPFAGSGVVSVCPRTSSTYGGAADAMDVDVAGS